MRLSGQSREDPNRPIVRRKRGRKIGQELRFGCQNVRTMMDNDKADAPPRRTAAIALALRSARADIVALSETRIAGAGECQEGEGNNKISLYWQGHETGSPKMGTGGVGIALSEKAVRQLIGSPRAISPRVMVAHFDFHITFISAYAPTFRSSDLEKNTFYDQLQEAMDTAPQGNMFVIAGDFNGRVGRKKEEWEGTLGNYGVGDVNENGIRLLEFCACNGLSISNTFFCHKPLHQYTWMHPKSKKWHMIDYVLVSKKLMPRVRDSRVFRSVDCWSDHQYVGCHVDVGRCKRRITTDSIRSLRRRANGAALRTPEHREKFQKAFLQQLSNAPVVDENNGEDQGRKKVEELWAKLKSGLQHAVEETVGFSRRRHQPDWWIENEEKLKPLLDAKREARNNLDKALMFPTQTSNQLDLRNKYRKARNSAKYAVSRARNNWWTTKGKELSLAFEKKDFRTLFGFWNKLNVKPGCNAALRNIRAKDGSLIAEPTAQRERWREHFQSILNQPSYVDPAIIAAVPKRCEATSLAVEPTLEELRRAVNALADNKAAGSDEIIAEMLKAGGQPVIQSLLELILQVWQLEVVPQEWIDAIIIPLPKKGDRTLCDNWRGISLLSLAGKAFVKIIERRLSTYSEDILAETQAGFRRGRGCIDHIFTVRQIAEKAREQNVQLLEVFFDLKKAYDTVNRQALWQLLTKYGVPDKVVNLLKALYNNMKATVEFQGERTEQFEVNNGLRQGCVISCALFNLFFDQVMSEARQGYEGDISLKLAELGHEQALIGGNRRRLSRLLEISTLEFADDVVAMALTKEKLQEFINRFAAAASRWGLTVNIQKTNVLEQPPPDFQFQRHSTACTSSFVVNEQTLTEVPSFCYLGSVLTNNADIDEEVKSRIGKACKTWNGLKGCVFHSKGLSSQAKLHVFKGAVLSTLLYGAETWTTKPYHIRRLQSFVSRCLRQILKQPTTGHKPDTALLRDADMLPIEVTLRKARLRWLGHVQRMSDSRLPKQILYGALEVGKRRVGRPRLRWKDCVHTDVVAFDISPYGLKGTGWVDIAAPHRDRWRKALHKGQAKNAKNIAEHKAKLRAIRKGNFHGSQVLCPKCGKAFIKESSLKSHITKKHSTQALQRQAEKLEQRQTNTKATLQMCSWGDCGRTFNNEAGLRQHLNKTHNIKNHEAQNQFITTSAKSSKMLPATPPQNYRCLHEGCTRTFPKLPSIKRHITRTHEIRNGPAQVRLILQF